MEMNKVTNDTISKPIEVTETQNFKTKFNISKPDFDLERNSSDSHDPYTVIDSTPNANYYRNLLSINGAFKTRPTLEELQV